MVGSGALVLTVAKGEVITEGVEGFPSQPRSGRTTDGQADENQNRTKEMSQF